MDLTFYFVILPWISYEMFFDVFANTNVETGVFAVVAISLDAVVAVALLDLMVDTVYWFFNNMTITPVPEHKIFFDIICDADPRSCIRVYHSLPLEIKNYRFKNIEYDDIWTATDSILRDYQRLHQTKLFAYHSNNSQKSFRVDFFSYREFTYCFRRIQELHNRCVLGFLHELLFQYQYFPQVEWIIKQQLIYAQNLHYFTIS